MKIKLLSLVLINSLICVSLNAVTYSNQTDVFPTGGGSSTVSNYSNFGTFGQSNASISTNSTYTNQEGFINAQAPVVPLINTVAYTNRTSNSASSGGEITSNGNSAITSKGLIWKVNSAPTLSSYDGRANNVANVSSFVSNLTGLNNSSKIYYRAFAENEAGTVYGSVSNYFYTYPTVQASNILWTSATQTSITANWTNGNGTNRLLLVKKASPISTIPLSDGTNYNASSSFGTGSLVDGAYVVYNSSANSASVTNLTRNTLYYFRVFESAGTGTDAAFLQTTATTNPTSRNTNRKENVENFESNTDFAEFTLSPNPAKDYINIKYNLNESKNLQMAIFDINGKMIYGSYQTTHFNSGENTIRIDCNNFPNGIYYINMSSDEGVYFYNFVIER
jgi:hypothetical protein